MNKSLNSNKLSHNGYTGSIEVSFEDNCLHGRVLFIDDIVTYEGETAVDLALAFNDAVDRYITYCKETGKPANKPCSGTFNVRIGEELHRKAVQEAYSRNITLNDFVAKAIKSAIATDLNNITKFERPEIIVNHIIETMVATTKEPSSWERIHATSH
jgi:predicted HicB family RNase H-like nuclease